MGNNAGSTSKTARASMPKKAAPKRPPKDIINEAITADVRWLIPLKSGHIYFHDPLTTRTLHLSTDPAVLQEAFAEVVKYGMGPRLRRELERFADFDLKWKLVLKQLEEVGGLEA